MGGRKIQNRVVTRVEDPEGYGDLVDHVMELGDGQSDMLDRIVKLEGAVEALCNRCTDVKGDANVAVLNAEALNRLTRTLQQRQDLLYRRHDETCMTVAAYTRECRDIAWKAGQAESVAKEAKNAALDAEAVAQFSRALSVVMTGFAMITVLVMFVWVVIR